MATLNAILSALATQIEDNLPTVTNADIQVWPYMVLAPSEICIDMWPADPPTDPQVAGFGQDIGDGWMVTVRARVATGDSDAGQGLLWDLMDDEADLSLIEAIMYDRTLSGNVSDMFLQAMTGARDFPDLSGESHWIGALWTLELVRARS